MDGVILAAGRGTRMGPLTTNRPKPILPVAGTPLIEHVLDSAVDVVDRFVIVIGYRGEQVRESIGDTFRDTPVAYVTQSERVGTADAVASAADVVDPPCLLLNGDVLIDRDSIDRLVRSEPPAMVGTRVTNPEEYGVLEIERDRLLGIVEKPSSPPSTLINAGAYLLDESLFTRMDRVDRSTRGEYELTDALEASITEGEGVRVIDHDGFWLDVGYPWDLLTATEHVLEKVEHRIDGTVDAGSTIEGPVVIERGAHIKAGTVIDGPVVVNEGATVGPNAYVRDGAVIGSNARVGHAVEVKNSILMDGATASHLTYLGDSIVGMDANLGAGTVTANLRHDGANVRVHLKGESRDTGRRKFGVILGDEVKTGINTSLNAGLVLDHGEMTMPGEVVLDGR